MNLVALLQAQAARRGDDVALTFIGEPDETMTYAGLDARARAIAALLQAHTRRGDRVVLLFQPGLDYVAAFCGCLYAGVVAVPVYLPRGPRQLPRLLAIVEDARPAAALGTAATLARLDLPGVKPLAIEAAGGDARVTPFDLAFLQYTSGSTGTPRGARVTQANLWHNAGLVHAAFGHGPDSVALLWVPPYHDMGLIGGIIQPLYGGFHGVLMSPTAFLKHPLGWLRAIDRFGATTSGGPNFAYDLCVERVKPQDLETIDLSRWKLAFNGAEPVRAATLDRFARTFAPCGFRREAFFPCYGLAEATLIVSGGAAREVPVSSEALARDVVEAGSHTLVSCGPVLGDFELRIVDPLTLLPCEPGKVGEIWLRGPSVVDGYWSGREGFREDGFLRTGDLGCLVDGELLVTGRLKDLVIVDGRNIYPQDLEASVERAHPTLKAGGGAAFALDGPTAERLVIVHEAERGAPVDEVLAAVRRAIAADHDLAPAAVALLLPGGLPRTSSGKVRRAACREAFVAKSLPVQAMWP
jgi:acyl-CoA synthetase (AMP-forming)/AMP-acid ligase II